MHSPASSKASASKASDSPSKFVFHEYLRTRTSRLISLAEHERTNGPTQERSHITLEEGHHVHSVNILSPTNRMHSLKQTAVAETTHQREGSRAVCAVCERASECVRRNFAYRHEENASPALTRDAAEEGGETPFGVSVELVPDPPLVEGMSMERGFLSLGPDPQESW